MKVSRVETVNNELKKNKRHLHLTFIDILIQGQFYVHYAAVPHCFVDKLDNKMFWVCSNTVQAVATKASDVNLKLLS